MPRPFTAPGVGRRGSPNCPKALDSFGLPPSDCTLLGNTGYGTVLSNLFNSTGPNKGAGFTLNIPIRNRPAQAPRRVRRSNTARRRCGSSSSTFRSACRSSTTSTRSPTIAPRSTPPSPTSEYNRQSLDAEIKKLHLGASTTANVLCSRMASPRPTRSSSPRARAMPRTAPLSRKPSPAPSTATAFPSSTRLPARSTPLRSSPASNPRRPTRK